jgi:2-oxo-4-hydroxy-4-carboxy-5-ureidoimidazoline decarboxylase
VPVFNIYKQLAWLNELPDDEASEVLLSCCGSASWAQQMTQRRPFRMLEDLFGAARLLWFRLSRADWLEAFAAHPQIGETGQAQAQTVMSAGWSREEQHAAAQTDSTVLDALAEANRLYKSKFGFIFIVCATGKTAEEMLAICRARYGNSVETELQIAAEEQFKITEIRLYKLLEQ